MESDDKLLAELSIGGHSDFKDEPPIPSECDDYPYTDYCLFGHDLEACRKDK